MSIPTGSAIQRPARLSPDVCVEPLNPAGALTPARAPDPDALLAGWGTTAYELFDAYVLDRRPSLVKSLSGHVEYIAGPHDPIDGLHPGDLLIRGHVGEGNAVVAALVDGELLNVAAAIQRCWRVESGLPGRYAWVVEGGDTPHHRDELWSRRLGDNNGYVLAGQAILRPLNGDQGGPRPESWTPGRDNAALFAQQELVPSGHSPEWDEARRLSAPEDRTQTDFVNWLAKPIAATDTAAIVERYNALHVLFDTMAAVTAGRMYERLTDPHDHLGQFARLELADWHRQQLIELAAARAHAALPGVPPPGSQPGPAQPPPPPHVPPQVPTPTPPPKPPGPVPPTPAPVYGTPPWPVPPGDVVVKLDPTTPSWLDNGLHGVARLLGVAISPLAVLVPAKVLEDATRAAWLVYQLEEGTPSALIGLAGERAAEVIANWTLEETLGVPLSKVYNLNQLAKNFPGLDLVAGDYPISVKTYGVLSQQTGQKLVDQLRSAYKKDAIQLFDGYDNLAVRYQRDKVADRLLHYKDILKQKGVWFPSLSGEPDVETVVQFIRDKGIMMVPADHVELVRQTMGEEYFKRYKLGTLKEIPTGLSDNDVAQRIDNLIIRRFVSSGLKSTDYRLMADVAGRLPDAIDAVLKRGKKTWPAGWGTPPTWTASLHRP